MKNRTNKKGFTIVELVIVIAVIAILAAVLIPTFAGLVKKAQLSADQQAVRQMNTALAVDGAVTPTDIFGLHEVLAELGLSSKDYKPLTKDTYFFWDADLNRVLHVDKDYVVIAPDEYAGQKYVEGTSNWYSLSLEIKEEKVAITDNKVTVSSGAQMKYVLNQLKEGTTKKLDITLDGTVDMMGAAFDLPEFKSKAGYNVTISGGTIKNATAVDSARRATTDRAGADGIYYCALIPAVFSGNDVTISNVTIENMSVKNADTSGVSLLIGYVGGGAKATIKDVTIKNSTVIGHRNTGALVGLLAGGELVIDGTVTLNNVDVMTVGGRSGLLVGLKQDAAKLTATGATINIDKDCSYSIYECAQNTGSAEVYNETTEKYETVKLGLQSDGTIYSYAPALVNGEFVNQFETKVYVENSLFMTSNTTAVTTTADFIVKCEGTLTGWN